MDKGRQINNAHTPKVSKLAVPYPFARFANLTAAGSHSTEKNTRHKRQNVQIVQLTPVLNLLKVLEELVLIPLRIPGELIVALSNNLNSLG